LKLNRDKITGKILDDKTPITLRGGHHDLFIKSNKAPRGLARPDEEAAFIVEYTGAPCVGSPPKCLPPPKETRFLAKELVWSDANKWEQLFGVLRDTKCNLLRVWVMSGTPVYPPKPGEVPFDLYPFVPVKVGAQWKWKVSDAVEHDVWNQPFFDRLADFAAKADRRGVCIQLTLFNYSDFEDDTNDKEDTFKTWSQSPWNPALSVNPADDTKWGATHLVIGATPRARNIFFIKPGNGLRQVQKALLRKIMTTLKGRGNIIFELMNEPRDATDKDVARFNSEMILAIHAVAADIGWTPLPLISVNASRAPSEPQFDTDWWREHSTKGRPDFVESYELVDIISYHGMTGFDNFAGVAACRRFLSVPRVDPTSMQERINLHKEAQEGRAEKKALMFSTDAARIGAFEHKYCGGTRADHMLSMEVRDGQIDTKYDSKSSDPPEQQAVKSDLRNWAFWYFSHALSPFNNHGGLIHFQNHSNFESSFRKILTGYEEVTDPASPFEP
jgi:hypothetical protein